MATKTLDEHIVTSPEIAGGKPRIAGHRITVQNIIVLHEWMGRSADEIATEYKLGLADVYAAIAYYFDHRLEIDETMKDSESFIKSLRHKTPSKLMQKIYGQKD